MIEQKYEDIVTEELLQDTLDHNAHTGFLQDYRVLSCLLKIYKPKTVFETGTNVGSGINVIATALPEAKIYSLDLPYETMRENSQQYPIGHDGEDRVGSAALYPYTQLRGDVLTFNFHSFPCEAYFVDDEHTYLNVAFETAAIVDEKPKLIIYHDADIPEVWKAIQDEITKDYTLYRVVDTRIAYAVRNSDSNI